MPHQRTLDLAQASPDWFRSAHVVSPFAEDAADAASPISYGGILRNAHEVAADDALVQAALAFAREEGLFRRSQPPQDEEQGLVVLWARRLDCDVVQDGPTCEQTLWEVAMPTADGGEQRGWCVYLSAV